MIRYTKLKIITKALISEIAVDYKLGKTVTKIANDTNFGFRRIRKLINYLQELPGFADTLTVNKMNITKVYKFII